MRVKAMPEIGLPDRVPRPIRFFRIDEDDARFRKFLIGVAPNIKVAKLGAGFGLTGALEPGMLIRRMVDDEFGDHPNIAPVRLSNEGPEIGHLAIGRIDVPVVRDVIPVIAQRRRIKRQQP